MYVLLPLVAGFRTGAGQAGFSQKGEKSPTSGHAPNLPTNIVPTNIA